jgi:hypothetical protein
VSPCVKSKNQALLKTELYYPLASSREATPMIIAQQAYANDANKYTLYKGVYGNDLARTVEVLPHQYLVIFFTTIHDQCWKCNSLEQDCMLFQWVFIY